MARTAPSPAATAALKRLEHRVDFLETRVGDLLAAQAGFLKAMTELLHKQFNPVVVAQHTVPAAQDRERSAAAIQEIARHLPPPSERRVPRRAIAEEEPQNHSQSQPIADAPAEPSGADDAQPADPMAALHEEWAEYGEEAAAPPPEPSAREQAQMWERRLKMFLKIRMWMPDWGPRPNQRGTLVPADLLEAYNIVETAA